MYLEQLETPRLLIRPLSLADKTPLMEFFSDPVATEFLFLDKTPEQFADQWLSRQLGRYASEQGGMCAVVLKETDTLIGQCGLCYQWVDFVPKWEVGYHFIRRFWGKGYATEAAVAMRDFCLKEEMAETVISLIHPDNQRSQAVAGRNGMTFWKNTTHRGHPAKVFRIRREDWEKL
jgi:RimJ/RimL family protein N-acetyltransferase